MPNIIYEFSKKLLPVRVKKRIASSIIYQYSTYIINNVNKRQKSLHQGIYYTLDNLDFSFKEDTFQTKIAINKQLKWNYGTVDWRGVYSGSSDRIIFKDILANKTLENLINQMNNSLLISVIGGGFFLDLLEKYNFNKILLFDNNINEHVKINSLLNTIISTNSSFEPRIFEKNIIENDNSFVPYLFDSHVSVDKEEIINIINDNYSTETTFPVLEKIDTYPDRAINQEVLTKNMIDRLKKGLLIKSFVTFPNIDVCGANVVVFLSNIHRWDIKNIDVYNSINNATSITIIRENSNYSNVSIENPNTHWKLSVNKKTRDLKTLHIVNNKKYLADYSSNSIFNKTILIKDLDVFDDYEAVIGHMLLSRVSRKFWIKRALKNRLKCIPSNIKKIIITEKNNSKIDEFRYFYDNLFTDYDLIEEEFIHGSNDNKRSILFVYILKGL
jgi:hypothetical protein